MRRTPNSESHSRALSISTFTKLPARRPRPRNRPRGPAGAPAPAGTEEAGALFRSRDLGDTWERLDIGDTPPSRMFQVAIPSESPNQVYCVSKDGHFFSSDDGGDSWASSRLPVETTRSLHVYPMACG